MSPKLTDPAAAARVAVLLAPALKRVAQRKRTAAASEIAPAAQEVRRVPVDHHRAAV